MTKIKGKVGKVERRYVFSFSIIQLFFTAFPFLFFIEESITIKKLLI